MKSLAIKTFQFILVISIFTFAIAVSVFADSEKGEKEAAFKMSVTTKPFGNTKSKLLRLTLTDRLPTTGPCMYYVKDFKYDAANQTLRIKMDKDFCPSEQMEKSSGTLYWVVPKVLTTGGPSVLQVEVNDQRQGQIEVL
jgi:hypothetical protein